MNIDAIINFYVVSQSYYQKHKVLSLLFHIVHSLEEHFGRNLQKFRVKTNLEKHWCMHMMQRDMLSSHFFQIAGFVTVSNYDVNMARI